jgi:hypothetical protein
MFTENIQKLITAENEDQEELVLGESLTAARKTNINYGYRVINKTKEKRVLPEEIDDYLDDDLEVTIFVGEKAPYEEFKWNPKYNGHITRLIVP